MHKLNDVRKLNETRKRSVNHASETYMAVDLTVW